MTTRQGFDKYDAEAIVDALEDAFEQFGMWDSYGDWQRAKGVILSEWKRSGGKSQRRMALDKRNVPELLSALEGLLTKKGLNKALNALERVKRGILREWKTIGVEALREQKHNRKPTFQHGPDIRPHLGANMDPLRRKLIRLAHENPELRPKLLPLLRSKEGAFRTSKMDPKLDKGIRNMIKNLGNLRQQLYKMGSEFRDLQARANRFIEQDTRYEGLTHPAPDFFSDASHAKADAIGSIEEAMDNLQQALSALQHGR